MPFSVLGGHTCGTIMAPDALPCSSRVCKQIFAPSAAGKIVIRSRSASNCSQCKSFRLVYSAWERRPCARPKSRSDTLANHLRLLGILRGEVSFWFFHSYPESVFAGSLVI
jgi:hypothetical protein